MTILLIDADLTCYASTASAEQEVQWDEDTWTIDTDLEQAKARFKYHLEDYQKLTGVSEFKLCFSHPHLFRKDIYADYKGNRKGRKPVGYKAVKEWALATYPSFMKEPLEADDCMGILATKFQGKTIIVSMDKDMATIPGKFFRLSPSGDHMMFDITEKEAEWNFLMQSMTGDASDGYPGIPGVGPKKAEELLTKHGAVWKTVEDAYLKAGLTAEDALVQGRLARILRADNWDFEKEEVKLWMPKI
jgi:DNA polymerase-1